MQEGFVEEFKDPHSFESYNNISVNDEVIFLGSYERVYVRGIRYSPEFGEVFFLITTPIKYWKKAFGSIEIPGCVSVRKDDIVSLKYFYPLF